VRPYFEVPFRLSTTAWIGGGLLAFIAPFVVLLWKKQRFSAATKELAILCVTLIALAVVFNFDRSAIWYQSFRRSVFYSLLFFTAFWSNAHRVVSWPQCCWH